MIKNSLFKNKKGTEFSTAIVDFYATITILAIIVVFFFIMHVSSNEMRFTLKDQEVTYAIDMTRFARIFVQSDVETTKGKMTFAEFIVAAAEDDSLQKELDILTKSYFTRDAKHLTAYGLLQENVKIPEHGIFDIFIVEKQKTKLIASSVIRAYNIAPPKDVAMILPLHDVDKYIIITVQVSNCDDIYCTDIMDMG